MVDPTGEFVGIAIGIGVGALIGGFAAWTVGYDGWGIVGGALLGGILGGASVAVVPLLPSTFLTFPSAARGAAPVLVAGGLLGIWLYSEWAFGDEPTLAEQVKIDRADQVIAATPGFNDYVNRRQDTSSWVFKSADFAAWGYDPHFFGKRVYLSTDLLTVTDDVFTASTIVHELQHTFQVPIWKASWRAEQWAYQAQSDFLRANGISGGVGALRQRFPNTRMDYLLDLRDSFEQYRVENPAVTG